MSSDGKQIKQLGNYVLKKKLGQGGMGSVYLAEQKSLNRLVAIKVLSLALSQDEDFVKRFQREAHLAANLNHPNVVKIYDIAQQDDLHYFVMEYVKGKSLNELLKDKDPPSLEESVNIIAKTASGLQYAHEQGVIHRDIKGSNIMVDEHGEPKIMDFGLARAAQGSKLTATGAVLGTPTCMSPEQALGNPVDHRTDIYSLGVVLYELLCGEVPFQAETPHGILYQHIHEPPPSLRQRNSDVPESLVGIVEHCLEKEPVDRFRSAGDFGSALVPPSDRTIVTETPLDPAKEPAARKKGSPALKVMVVLAVVLAVAVAGGLWFAKSQRNVDKKGAEKKRSKGTATVDDVIDARTSAKTVRTTAETAGAKEHANSVMEEGNNSFKRAEEYDRLQAFDKAKDAYDAAASKFTEAKTTATQMKSEIAILSKAKKSMEQAVSEAKKNEASKHASSLNTQAEDKRREGESFEQGGDRLKASKAYDSASSLYVAAAKEAGVEFSRLAAVKEAAEKTEADSARTSMASAKTRARNAEAETYAKSDYGSGESREAEGDTAYNKKHFITARSKYDDAESSYSSAANKAPKEKVRLQAKNSADAAKLRMEEEKHEAEKEEASEYAKPDWDSAKSYELQGDSAYSRGDYVTAKSKYAKATNTYNDAALEAQEEENRIQAKKLAEQAEKKMAVAKREAEKERASEHAKSEWDSAKSYESQGDSAYVRGEYKAAGNNYASAEAKYRGSASAARVAPKVGETRRFAGIEFVWIPPGTFQMGANSSDSDEKPVHAVTISKGFWMGKYEVSQTEWKSVMDSNPSHFKSDSNSVDSVSWDVAQEFIKRLNAKGQGHFRLPTEAEWEYACRANTTTAYSFGSRESSLGSYASYTNNSDGKTHPVGQRKPNPWGLYDMHGNVWEWCHDWYDENYYSKSPSQDPEGADSGSYRVLRGGSWGDTPGRLRSASRYWRYPSHKSGKFGFRLLKDL
ncbi:SUMF1/EgtB/PvdO family nonheme iron enzyme [Candidatus Hydrogenedentota bacterium]